MKLQILILYVFVCLSLKGISQTCVVPGSLVSVNNMFTEKYDYLVFKFLKPHTDKGFFSKTSAVFFPKANSNKNTNHKITFNNVANFCYNKVNVSAPTKRLLNFKVDQQNDHMVSYVFELAEGKKIMGHYVYKHHGFYIVKVRIE